MRPEPIRQVTPRLCEEEDATCRPSTDEGAEAGRDEHYGGVVEGSEHHFDGHCFSF